MMSPFQTVAVGDVLELKRRVVAIKPAQEYRLIGIYSFGKGIFHRQPKAGAELGDYRFFRVEPSDLVLSNIQAWEGAIGYATEADAGTVGTNRFLTYVPVDGRIDANWARWFFLSEQGMLLIRRAAPGTTMRNRTLAIQRFEALEIPLPPVDQQRRVAARLDAVRAATVDLSRRSVRAGELLDALAVSISARPDLSDSERSALGWRKVSLGAVMEQVQDRVAVEPGGAYPNLGIYSFGRGLFAKADIDGGVTSAKVLNRVQDGQFIYSRLFAFEGAYAYVSPDFAGRFVSNEFPTFNVDEGALEVRWRASYLRSPDRWRELATSSKGLGVRRQRVPVESVLAYIVWLPPIGEQREMVRTIERLHAVAAARERSDQRVEALTPAALNFSFGINQR